MVKSDGVDNHNLDQPYNLIFLADCRNHPDLSIPQTYFGNCLVSRIVRLKRGQLVGESGFMEAVNAIESKVRDIKSNALRGAETLMSDSRKLSRSGAPRIIIAGSPKLGVYETDFGCGKPMKSEVVHIEHSSAISLSDCRDEEHGGVEIGVALPKTQMDIFTAILEEQLTKLWD